MARYLWLVTLVGAAHGRRGAATRLRPPVRAAVRLSTVEQSSHAGAEQPEAEPTVVEPAVAYLDSLQAPARDSLGRASSAPESYLDSLQAPARGSLGLTGSAPTERSIESFLLRSGPPAFFWPTPPSDDVSKPVLVYLPGLEMTGYTMSSQLERLAPQYDVRIFRVAPGDLTPGVELHSWVEPELEALAAQGRKIVLMGESFGGVLALDVLLRLTERGAGDCVSHLVLMNPATCMPATPWPSLASTLESLPPEAFRALPLVLSPILSNPLRLIDFTAAPAHADGPPRDDRGAAAAALAAAFNATEPLPFAEQLAALGTAAGAALAALGRSSGPVTDPGASGWADPDLVLARFLGLLPVLNQLPSALPQPTLAFRLRELDALARDVNGRDWSKARTPTLVIASSADLLIPSPSAARQIQSRLLGTRVRALEGAGHAPLLETNIDLLLILTEGGVLTQPRPAPRDFASVATSDLASPERQAQVSEETLRPIRRLTSPKFFSTTSSGVRLPGLSAVPSLTDASGKPRPILFVGNHQQGGVLDIPLVVEELLVQRGIFTRSLAHPVAFRQASGAPGDELSEQQLRQVNSQLSETARLGVDARGRNTLASKAQVPEASAAQGGGGGGGRGGMLGGSVDIAEFGAIPVSGRGLFRLLQRNEAVLLYPGGARAARAHSLPRSRARCPDPAARCSPPHAWRSLPVRAPQASRRPSRGATASTSWTGRRARASRTSCGSRPRRTRSSCPSRPSAATTCSTSRTRTSSSSCRGWATRSGCSPRPCLRAAWASASSHPSRSRRSRSRASTSHLAGRSTRPQSTPRTPPRPPPHTPPSSASSRPTSRGCSSAGAPTRTPISRGASRTRPRATGSARRPRSASSRR